MKHDFHKGVSGLLLDPSPGSDVSRIAELTIQMAESMRFIGGFVFNGVIVRIGSDDTVDSLVAKYHCQMAADPITVERT